MPPDQVEDAMQPPCAHAVIAGQLDLRFKPKLRLSVGVMDVDMRSHLFTRE
jgi:hypothetical protein